MKRNSINRTKGNFVMVIGQSKYSRLYGEYMKREFASVQVLIKKFIRLAYCRELYLKYPLQGLLKGICKRLLVNLYEFTVYAYFLLQVQWRLDNHYIFGNIAEVFPNIIHVNEPTNIDKLKQISMFFYFSCYSIKEFLNEDMNLLRKQMVKIFPQFERLQAHWSSTQQTVGHVLNPRALNGLFKSIHRLDSLADLNVIVDRILQVSPCYDIASRSEKQKELPQFGYMNVRSEVYNFECDRENPIKLEENLQDYQFDGEI